VVKLLFTWQVAQVTVNERRLTECRVAWLKVDVSSLLSSGIVSNPWGSRRLRDSDSCSSKSACGIRSRLLAGCVVLFTWQLAQGTVT